MTSFVALLALVALSPQAAAAHGGGHSGGGPYSGGGGGYYGRGGGYYGGIGLYGNPYGYGYSGKYGYYEPATSYVAQQPILENPVFSGLPIEITNPATTGVTLSYVLNDVNYSIPPGYSQNLTLDRPWVISFSRGGNFGPALRVGARLVHICQHGSWLGAVSW